VGSGPGLFCRISSILAMISGVNLGMTSRALRFSSTCSGLDAPRMTVDVFGFTATHARARCVTLQLSSGADGQQGVSIHRTGCGREEKGGMVKVGVIFNEWGTHHSRRASLAPSPFEFGSNLPPSANY